MDAIETGGTAMHTKHSSPALKYLWKKGYISPSMTAIDFGAGHGRNADWMRANGIPTYAYDPYTGTDCDGWTGVSNKFPTRTADVLITIFVLNVLTRADELEVLEQVKQLAPVQFHIVRNRDLEYMFSTALENHKQPYWSEYNELRFAKFGSHVYSGYGDVIPYDGGAQMLYNGFKTNRGFQRLVDLEEHDGFMCIRETHGYKVFTGELRSS